MTPGRVLALFAAKDIEALIDAAFPLLRTAVACDFTTALYRSAGKGLLKERDSRGREYDPAFMRRYAELTPALPLALASPGIKILTTRTALPQSVEELHRSAFYLEIMQQQGWRHGVALCFWGNPPAESPVFVATVYRTEQQSDFSDQEVSALEGVHPFLDCAVNDVRERETAKTVRDGMAIAVGDEMPGVLILDRNLNLVQANSCARRLCAAWADDAVVATDEIKSRAWRLPHTDARLAVDWRCRHKPVFTGFGWTAPIASRGRHAAAASLLSGREVQNYPRLGPQVARSPTVPDKVFTTNGGSVTEGLP